MMQVGLQAGPRARPRQQGQLALQRRLRQVAAERCAGARFNGTKISLSFSLKNHFNFAFSCPTM